MDPSALAQLRDIHPPLAVSWWPPAPGWWLLALIAVALVGAALVLTRRWRQRRYLRAARKLLTICWQSYLESRDDARLIEDALALVRRALRRAGRGADAPINGEALPTPVLLAHLNVASHGGLERAIPLPTLATRLYAPTAQPISEAQARELCSAINCWLKRPRAPLC